MSRTARVELAGLLEGEGRDFIVKILALYDKSSESDREWILKFTRDGGIAKVDAAKDRFELRRDSQ